MVVVPQKCLAEGAVDRGSVLQIAGPNKAEKECPCMCAAKYGTWRAEDEVFYVGHKDVLQSGEQSVQRLCMRKCGVRKVYLSTPLRRLQNKKNAKKNCSVQVEVCQESQLLFDFQ